MANSPIPSRSPSRFRTACRRFEPVERTVVACVTAAADELTLFGQCSLLVEVVGIRSSSRLLATIIRLAFCQGPLPMRSRALTPSSCSDTRTNWSQSNRRPWQEPGQWASAPSRSEVRAVSFAHTGDKKRHVRLLGLGHRRQAKRHQSGGRKSQTHAHRRCDPRLTRGLRARRSLVTSAGRHHGRH